MNKELHFHRDSDKYDYVAKAKGIKYGILKAYNDTWCVCIDDFERGVFFVHFDYLVEAKEWCQKYNDKC